MAEQTACEFSLAIRLARTLLEALPKSQQELRNRIADFCESVPGDDILSDKYAQMWVAICSHWMVSLRWHKADSASRQALAHSRELAATGGDLFWLYSALSQSATISARGNDLETAERTLAELARLGKAAGEDHWPPHRLMASAQARSSVARIAGDPKAALAAERHRLALEKAAGATLFLSMSNLMDAEIAAGEAAEAVQTGLELMGHLQDSREAYALSNGRLNLAAAWLALGEPGQARALASAAWPMACGFNQQAYWADYLSLLACQEMRWRSAAMLAGYSVQAYVNASTSRDRNEASAFNRAVNLARSALGDDEFERLVSAGRLLTDDAAALCAFGLDDGTGQATA